MSVEHFDVLIVGAGISGIGAGYHLQTQCPGKSYAILEGRGDIGGTWDLFRYPGIRSDSDMFTLGYSFRPWKAAKSIADGPAILTYLRETAHEFGIDRHIRFQHRVKSAAWSSEDAQWTVDAEVGEDRQARSATRAVPLSVQRLLRLQERIHAGLRRQRGFPRAAGTPPTLAAGSRLPRQARRGDRQRRDGGDSGPRDGRDGRARDHAAALADVHRLAAVGGSRRPGHSPAFAGAEPRTGSSVGKMSCWACTSTSSAGGRPGWPRGCFAAASPGSCRRASTSIRTSSRITSPGTSASVSCPNADLFQAIKAGACRVVTDQIANFTQQGILLKSGKELPADIIVTATGLKLLACGGIRLSVDGTARRAGAGADLQGVDAERCAELRGVRRLHQRLVDAAGGSVVGVCLPPDQPHGPSRLQAVRSRVTTRSGAYDPSRCSASIPATCSGGSTCFPSRDRKRRGCSRRTTSST